MRVGQGIFLKINYADGGRANYKRPFLIIEIGENEIYMLNISSLHGKEYKLGFKSNYNIENYSPPFIYPSFIKLDALYIVENSGVLENFILDNGRAMNPTEFTEIESRFNDYRSKNQINIRNYSIGEILDLNNTPIIDEAAAGSIENDNDLNT